MKLKFLHLYKDDNFRQEIKRTISSFLHTRGHIVRRFILYRVTLLLLASEGTDPGFRTYEPKASNNYWKK